ncbi:MAG: ABC transporter substrate-binding protein [Eubacteriales bacterium]
MIKKAFLITGLIIALFITGCARTQTGDKQQKESLKMPDQITVQAPIAPATAPLLKMASEGLPSGVKINLIIYKTDEEATTRVIKNEADFSILSTNLAAKLYNKEVDISLANVNTWGILYLISAEDGVTEWNDLKGKELYVGARGSTPDVLTRYFLHKNGLSENDLKITYLQSPEIARMIISGLAKNAVLPEPMVTQVLLNNNKARIIENFYEDWKTIEGGNAGLPQAGMIVRNSFANSYPSLVASFQQAYASALDETVKNPAGSASLVQTSLQIPAPVFVQSIKRTHLKYVEGEKAKKDVEIYLSRLLELSPEMVGGKLPDEKFFLKN